MILVGMVGRGRDRAASMTTVLEWVERRAMPWRRA